MKIALSQISSDPGRIENNTRKILQNIERARGMGMDLIIFPELTIPGYLMLDLAYHADLIEANLKALKEVQAGSKDIAVVVGFIDKADGRRPGKRPLLYNSAAVIKDRELLGVQDKSLLPNYGIFFEDRYFVPARDHKVFKIGKETLGVEICEDLWDHEYPDKITKDLKSLGASLIVNISASPFEIGKLAERQSLMLSASRDNGLPLLYNNLVGSFDGYEGEVVFDGRSMVYDSAGRLCSLGKAFGEDFLVVDTKKLSPVEPPALSWEEECLSALALGVKDYMRRAGLHKIYVGLSGGIDSALAAYIAVRAIGPEYVTGVTMPSHVTGNDTKSDAFQTAKSLGMRCLERPITAEYRTWEKEFAAANNKDPAPLTKQNKQARLRGNILMEYTNEDRSSVVLNTGNKTELALGYCTLYGDMCGGLSVLGDVSKERVYALARYVNREAGREIIPNSVIERVPTAELEEGQTDRANLPADYPVLSPLVDRIVEDEASYTELCTQYPAAAVKETMRLIDLNEFKRRQAPPAVRITRRAFGVGRRVPLGINFEPYIKR